MPDRPSPISGVIPPAHARFRKGMEGNPKGRPKGFTPVSVYLARLMIQVGVTDLAGMANDPRLTVAERGAAGLLAGFVAGDVASAREVMDRTEGKVPNKIDGQLDMQVSYVDIARQLLLAADDDFEPRLLASGDDP